MTWFLLTLDFHSTVRGDVSGIIIPAPGAPPTRPFNVIMEIGNLVGDGKGGNIMISVQPDWAPHAAARFKHLVEAGFYDGSRFFLVKPGFAAQTGIHADPATQAAWSLTAPIPEDPLGVQSNVRGTVAFAIDGELKRNTQFFVTVGDYNSNLDKSHQPFAKIVSVTGRDGLPTLERLYHRKNPVPVIARIRNEGNTYLEQNFPDLSYIKKAWIR